jgi:hypothetical protein
MLMREKQARAPWECTAGTGPLITRAPKIFPYTGV